MPSINKKRTIRPNVVMEASARIRKNARMERSLLRRFLPVLANWASGISPKSPADPVEDLDSLPDSVDKDSNPLSPVY
jgi:hypothetical protein